MQQPDITTPAGLRDRAILETFYATGMRRMEAGQSQAVRPRRRPRHDDDPPGQGQEGPLSFRSASGRWRGSRSTSAKPRPHLLTGSRTMARCFSTTWASRSSARISPTLVRVYLAKSKIGKMGGCHLFRHTVATLMLENGADIRVIQQMLGPRESDHHEIYTHVSINLLQASLLRHPSRRPPEARRSHSRTAGRTRHRSRGRRRDRKLSISTCGLSAGGRIAARLAPADQRRIASAPEAHCPAASAGTAVPPPGSLPPGPLTLRHPLRYGIPRAGKNPLPRRIGWMRSRPLTPGAPVGGPAANHGPRFGAAAAKPPFPLNADSTAVLAVKGQALDRSGPLRTCPLYEGKGASVPGAAKRTMAFTC